jgi:hypothetical protein
MANLNNLLKKISLELLTGGGRPRRADRFYFTNFPGEKKPFSCGKRIFFANRDFFSNEA